MWTIGRQVMAASADGLKYSRVIRGRGVIVDARKRIGVGGNIRHADQQRVGHVQWQWTRRLYLQIGGPVDSQMFGSGRAGAVLECGGDLVHEDVAVLKLAPA